MLCSWNHALLFTVFWRQPAINYALTSSPGLPLNNYYLCSYCCSCNLFWIFPASPSVSSYESELQGVLMRLRSQMNEEMRLLLITTGIELIIREEGKCLEGNQRNESWGEKGTLRQTCLTSQTERILLLSLSRQSFLHLNLLSTFHPRVILSIMSCIQCQIKRPHFITSLNSFISDESFESFQMFLVFSSLTTKVYPFDKDVVVLDWLSRISVVQKRP